MGEDRAIWGYEHGRMNAMRVAALVAEAFGVSRKALLSRSKAKSIFTPRLSLYWLLRKQQRTFNEIGRLLDRDHTTIFNGVARIEDQRTYDTHLGKTLTSLLGRMEHGHTVRGILGGSSQGTEREQEGGAESVLAFEPS